MNLSQEIYDIESSKMKTIGLIGGISYQSTIEYYRIINDEANRIFGGHHFAKCIINSLDLEPVLYLQEYGDWQGLSKMVTDAALDLKKAGAEIIVICSNTTNKIAPYVQDKVGLPLLHIVDATAKKIRAEGLKTIALLGTKFTMEQSFYKERLQDYGIEVLIPDGKEREIIHNVIYEELDYGVLNKESRQKYLDIITKMAQKGAEGVILGCTEIPLLIKQKDCTMPVFDTTAIHAAAAVEMAVEMGQ